MFGRRGWPYSAASAADDRAARRAVRHADREGAFSRACARARRRRQRPGSATTRRWRRRRVRDTLSGAQRAELAGAIAKAEGIDARGQLTSSRVNAIVMTLERNSQFWPANVPPVPGTWVVFTGSPVILEYYAGSGLQIQPLANFGKANAHWNTCNKVDDRTCTPLRELLDAMLALTSTRGGFSTWEYFFELEGRPAAVDERHGAGHRDPVALARVPDDARHPLALIGLDAYRNVTGDSRATTLFNSGDSHGRWLIPYSDTGSWSRYSLNGPESTREYHVLLRDFLKNLCGRVAVPVYCDTASRFTSYLATRPAT